MNTELKTKLRILLAEFSMYLANDTGAANDDHEGQIKKFEDFFSLVLASERTKTLEEVDSELVELAIKSDKQYSILDALDVLEKLSINGNAGDKSEAVRASSEVSGESKEEHEK